MTWVPAGNPPWVAAPAARPSTAAPGPVLPGPGAPRVPCGVPEAAAELAGDGAVGPRPPPADAGRRAARDVSWMVPCPTPSGIGDPVLAATFEGTRDWNPGPAIEDVRKTVATSVAPTARLTAERPDPPGAAVPVPAAPRAAAAGAPDGAPDVPRRPCSGGLPFMAAICNSSRGARDCSCRTTLALGGRGKTVCRVSTPWGVCT